MQFCIPWSDIPWYSLESWSLLFVLRDGSSTSAFTTWNSLKSPRKGSVGRTSRSRKQPKIQNSRYSELQEFRIPGIQNSRWPWWCCGDSVPQDQELNFLHSFLFNSRPQPDLVSHRLTPCQFIASRRAFEKGIFKLSQRSSRWARSAQVLGKLLALAGPLGPGIPSGVGFRMTKSSKQNSPSWSLHLIFLNIQWNCWLFVENEGKLQPIISFLLRSAPHCIPSSWQGPLLIPPGPRWKQTHSRGSRSFFLQIFPGFSVIPVAETTPIPQMLLFPLGAPWIYPFLPVPVVSHGYNSTNDTEMLWPHLQHTPPWILIFPASPAQQRPGTALSSSSFGWNSVHESPNSGWGSWWDFPGVFLLLSHRTPCWWDRSGTKSDLPINQAP